MANEKLINNPNGTSTLNTALSDGTGTTVIVDSATPFPTVPQFRIRIENELMLVTAVSGTTFTVTRGIEGSTGVSHGAGCVVSCVITSQAITNIQKLWAKFPASAGFVPPDYNSFSWQNPGTATATQVGNTMTISDTTSSSDDLRFLYQSVPAGHYQVTAYFQCPPVFPTASGNEIRIGLGWSQPTNTPLGNCYWYRITNSGLPLIARQQWSNFSTISSTLGAGTVYNPDYWLRISDDGTNFLFSISHDGLNFVQMASMTRIAAANRVGIMFSHHCSTFDLNASVISYELKTLP